MYLTSRIFGVSGVLSVPALSFQQDRKGVCLYRVRNRVEKSKNLWIPVDLVSPLKSTVLALLGFTHFDDVVKGLDLSSEMYFSFSGRDWEFDCLLTLCGGKEKFLSDTLEHNGFLKTPQNSQTYLDSSYF